MARSKVPVAVGVPELGSYEDEAGLQAIHKNEPLLGIRFAKIVVFRTHPDYDPEWVREYLECRLHPDGTWIEV